MSSRAEYRYEKHRAEAVVNLAGGETVRGYFFTAAGSPLHAGSERVGDLLNAESGFLPFELLDSGGRTILYNRPQVITVRVFDDEARRDTGYSVAAKQLVSLLLSDGRRLTGAVRIYRPEGRDRLSDWTRQPEAFRYIESDEATIIVNAAHIVSLHEVSGS
jgi:hypothetical protein